MLPYGVHWFRRDLRVAGNPALSDNWTRHQGRVVGFFCFDPQFLARPDFSSNRFAFFLQTLRALREELRSLGSDLLVVEGAPEEAWGRLLDAVQKSPAGLPKVVTFNRDYEPFARARDEKILRLLQSERQVGVWTRADHCLVEPNEIKKPDRPYQVYTPYSRKWMEVFQTEVVQDRVAQQKTGLEYLKKREAGERIRPFSLTWAEIGHGSAPLLDRLDKYVDEVRSSVPLPAAGSLAAYRALEAFEPKLGSYETDRDVPAVPGTSRFSIYFKNGSLTIAQAIAHLKLRATAKKETGGRAKFLSELVWREFYYYILFHHPHVETTAFQERFKDLKWENRRDWFEAWKLGRTGFPLVDAGMRELLETGWMHNRVRMVVSSFLTKDLLIDWKWGERWFMQMLLDGDLAPNNGGWQWAASTGCDPQPYFRIFNPILQSKRFDPDGAYIRRYVPELAHLPASRIHEPEGVRGYPQPIVDHAEARARALTLYSESV